MIVITLSKVPPSLRGALTKWCQEIQTGVYVGKFSARIRDALWNRIERDIGSGEATIVFNAKNELGYQFRTTRADHEVIDLDGLPFLLLKPQGGETIEYGFSNAAKQRKVHKFSASSKKTKNPHGLTGFLALDIETTGLYPDKDSIIAVGAVGTNDRGETETFYHLVNTKHALPASITELTGLSDTVLSDAGEPLVDVMKALKRFANSRVIIGYNVRFDDQFLAASFQKTHLSPLNNRVIDLERIVKRDKKFLENYRLMTVLKAYEIINEQPHNALADAHATFSLAMKLIKSGLLKIDKS